MRAAMLRVTGLLLATFLLCAAPCALAQKPPLEKVKYATVLTIEGDLPIIVARQKGYFADEGLDVEFVLLGGALTREALLSGDARFGLLHITALWPAIDKKLQLKFISAYYTKEMFSVLASTRLKDQVRSLADLKGRRVMTFAPGGASYAAALFYFKKIGLDLHKDVQVVTVSSGDPRVWLSALDTGKVDALAAAWDPTVSTVLANDVGYLLLDIRDPAVHERFVGGDTQTLGIAASEATIREHPDLVRRFQRATNRALQQIRASSPENLAADVAASGLVALDKAALTRTIATMKPNYQADGSPSRPGYERALRMYLDAGYLKTPIPFESVYSNIAQ